VEYHCVCVLFSYPSIFQPKLSLCDLGDKDPLPQSAQLTITVGIRAQIIAKLRVILI